MKLRFVQYQGEIWAIVGIGHRNIPQGYRDVNNLHKSEECFELVPIRLYASLIRAGLSIDTQLVPFNECIEIQDKDAIQMLAILYG